MDIKPTQTDQVKKALLAGEALTQPAAAKRFNCFRLAPVIERLRRRGWPVSTTLTGKSRMAVYRLPDGWRTPAETPDAKKPR
jgi:hypothetical protein